MKMKYFPLLLAAVLLCFCGCSSLDNVALPERTASATPAPTPEPTPQPTPSPTPIPAPQNLDALSELIGVSIEPPREPIAGYTLSSIGYDGEKSGALKYTTSDETTYLLYTVTDGTQTPDANFDEHFVLTVNGIEVYAVATDEVADETHYSRALWYKNANTYQLLAEPALDSDALIGAISEMMSAAQNNNAASVETPDLPSLETVVGFSVPAPSYVPSGYTCAHIYALYGQLPVQIYTSETVELTFVKSEGIVHPPRFSHIEYTAAGEYALADGTQVSLYYTENGISLAEWIVGGYGYSVTATDLDGNPVDIARSEFLKLIDGFAEA